MCTTCETKITYVSMSVIAQLIAFVDTTIVGYVGKSYTLSRHDVGSLPAEIEGAWNTNGLLRKALVVKSEYNVHNKKQIRLLKLNCDIPSSRVVEEVSQ